MTTNELTITVMLEQALVRLWRIYNRLVEQTIDPSVQADLVALINDIEATTRSLNLVRCNLAAMTDRL
jgi:hypothetical protein